jgi:hypothetical protein
VKEAILLLLPNLKRLKDMRELLPLIENELRSNVSEPSGDMTLLDRDRDVDDMSELINEEDLDAADVFGLVLMPGNSSSGDNVSSEGTGATATVVGDVGVERVGIFMPLTLALKLDNLLRRPTDGAALSAFVFMSRADDTAARRPCEESPKSFPVA